MLELESKNEKKIEKKSFSDLGICNNLLRVIEEERFERPTEIQKKSIPFVVKGKDVIARASTGSGKTLAFSSAIVKNTKRGAGIQALILTPTRELAEQISRMVGKLSKHSHLKVIPVYGGVSISNQIRELRTADVVVATPGRMLDHLSRKTINLSKLSILVLDEADRMLDMGFKDDIEKIIKQCPKRRQTLLFSATMPVEIIELAKRYMNNAIEISAEQYVDPAKMTQVYYDVDQSLKLSLLKHLLENEKSKLVMIFCNTRRNVDFVAKNLNANGVEVMPIHGGFSQDKRSKIMERFNSNQSKNILICTDVAARGLDIPGVTHVYNYDIPKDSKEYLHRIGRTARAGKDGKVINLLSNFDYENFSNIMSKEDIKIAKEETPYVKRIEVTGLERNPRRNFSRGKSAGRRPFGQRSQGGGYRGNRRDDGRGGRRDDGRDDRKSYRGPRDARRSPGRNQRRDEGRFGRRGWR
jgi:ATP-dependent RNA helicase DeaD